MLFDQVDQVDPQSGGAEIGFGDRLVAGGTQGTLVLVVTQYGDADTDIEFDPPAPADGEVVSVGKSRPVGVALIAVFFFEHLKKITNLPW